MLLYPVLLLLSGLWLARIEAEKVRVLACLAAAFAIAISAVFPTLRNSAAFHGTDSSDMKGRLQLLAKTTQNLDHGAAITEVGRDLYAWSDPYLFQEPGISQAPAGNKRLGNLIYLWIPKALMPDRPEINDGHLIVKEIMEQPDAGTHEGRHIWFPGISFGADLYWRYRWTGVIIGSLAFGAFYAAMCRVWYHIADLNKNTLSALIALYPSTFLQGPPLRSVSETAWNWLYEFPKYIAILLVLTLLIEGISWLWTRRRLS